MKVHKHFCNEYLGIRRMNDWGWEHIFIKTLLYICRRHTQIPNVTLPLTHIQFSRFVLSLKHIYITSAVVSSSSIDLAEPLLLYERGAGEGRPQLAEHGLAFKRSPWDVLGTTCNFWKFARTAQEEWMRWRKHIVSRIFRNQVLGATALLDICIEHIARLRMAGWDRLLSGWLFCGLGINQYLNARRVEVIGFIGYQNLTIWWSACRLSIDRA